MEDLPLVALGLAVGGLLLARIPTLPSAGPRPGKTRGGASALVVSAPGTGRRSGVRTVPASRPPVPMRISSRPGATSACRTPQSIVPVFWPSHFLSVTERSERPMRRWISTARPSCLPDDVARGVRLLVARGSIAYSAVTQPLPLPIIQRGTCSLTEAVHHGA